MITWVIGSGGLLGSAIAAEAGHLFLANPIPWADADAAEAVLRAEAARFRQVAGDNPWAIIWAAGAATVATSAEQAASELRMLTTVAQAIADEPPRGRGVFFLSSSAGGVYAGSATPPFSCTTTPVSLSAYGDLKLAQEAAAVAALMGICPLVIGRFSNIYGPGQNLDKLQGLISRLSLAAATRQPINIFVSLDTIRDYIYVEDAARATLHWIDEVMTSENPPNSTTVVIASGQPTVLGQLIRLIEDIAKTRIPVALGSHSSASAQVGDLRLEPTAPTTPLPHAPMPLPAGAKRVYLDILEHAHLQGRA
ncbi:MAG: NAD-dependent epimerase/dehydratase family protein [Actinomycetes bacterium]